MTLPLEHYLNQTYAVWVTPYVDADGQVRYFAVVAELPGCESHGDTPAEAQANLRDALSLYIETMLEDGLEPPAPAATAQAVVWRSIPAAGASWAAPALPLRAGGTITAPEARLAPA